LRARNCPAAPLLLCAPRHRCVHTTSVTARLHPHARRAAPAVRHAACVAAAGGMRKPERASGAAAAAPAPAAPRVKLRWKALLRTAFGEDAEAELKLKRLRRRACDAALQAYADAGAAPPDRRVHGHPASLLRCPRTHAQGRRPCLG
jgi:hypothetical protein